MEPSQGAGVDGAVIRLGLAIAKGAKRIAGHTEIEPTLATAKHRTGQGRSRKIGESAKGHSRNFGVQQIVRLLSELLRWPEREMQEA
jgi:hypothetical protein